MNQTDLQVVVAVVDQATKPLENIQKNLVGLTKQLAGYAAGYVGFKKIYDAMTQSENASSKLTKTLAGIGVQSGITSMQVTDMAKAIGDVSKFSTTDVKIAAEQLIRFRAVTAANLEPVMKTTALLAQQMGTDLPQAAMTMSRAMLAPAASVRLLRQYGVQLTAVQLEQIRTFEKHGEHGKAQAVVLEAIAKVTGNATLKVSTMSAAVAQLGNRFSDLIEGRNGGLKQATEAVKKFSDLLDDPNTKIAVDDLLASMVKILSVSIEGWTKLYTVTKSWFDLVGDGKFNDKALAKNSLLAEYNMAQQQQSDAASGKLIGNPRTKAEVKARIDANVKRLEGLLNINKSDEKAAALMKSTEGARNKVLQDRMSNMSLGDGSKIGYPNDPPVVDQEAIDKAIADARDSMQRLLDETFGAKESDQIIAKIRTTNQIVAAAIKNDPSQENAYKEALAQVTAKYSEWLGNALGNEALGDEVTIAAKKVIEDPMVKMWEELAAGVKGPWMESKKALDGLAFQIDTFIQHMAEVGKPLDDAEVADMWGNFYEKQSKASERAAKETDEYGKEAMRGIQNSLKSFLIDPFNDGLKGMAFNIVKTFRDIIAEIIAAKLAEQLVTKSGLGDFIGNLVGGMFGAPGVDGATVSNTKAFPVAGGGRVPPNSLALVGENGPELVASGALALHALASGAPAASDKGITRNAGSGQHSGRLSDGKPIPKDSIFWVGKNGPEYITSGRDAMQVVNANQIAFRGVKDPLKSPTQRRSAGRDIVRAAVRNEVLPGTRQSTRKPVSRAAPDFHRAGGGRVPPNRVAMVGENGPELIASGNAAIQAMTSSVSPDYRKASGGRVPANRIAMVGENGPELIASGREAMQVMNKQQVGGGTVAAPVVTVAPVYNIDARGATMDLVKALPAILAENTRQAVQMSRAAVREDFSRGAYRR